MKLKDLFEDNVNVGGSSNSQFFKTYDETKNWLGNHGVKLATINKSTLVVDVSGSVDIYDNNITKLPVKFGKVAGWFSLSRMPYLESLVGCPNDIKGAILCRNTNIKNFVGLENTVRIVDASYNKILESFEGLPSKMNSLHIEFSCRNITSLDHFPVIISETLSIGPDFKLIPKLHKHMKNLDNVDLYGDHMEYSNILQILHINGINTIMFRESPEAETILNSEIRRQPDPRKRNLLKVAQELSNAGFHHLTV